MQTDNLSRFKTTEPITIDQKETYGLWDPPTYTNLTQLNTNQIITIKIDQSLAGRPDLIANKHYGTPLLEWVIIMSNKPQNPLGWPKTGQTIKIPNRTLIAGA